MVPAATPSTNTQGKAAENHRRQGALEGLRGTVLYVFILSYGDIFPIYG
jgi:hypothetical protein